MLLALALAGCAASASAGHPAGGTGPGAVALLYARALFAGHFAAASRYVAPASRNSLLALTDGLRSSSITGRDLAVGSTTVAGSAATAVLTGTVCSTGSTAALPSAGPGPLPTANCVTNTDPHSTSPVFTVHLAQGSGDRWLVVFLEPSAAPSPSSLPNVAGSSSAPPS